MKLRFYCFCYIFIICIDSVFKVWYFPKKAKQRAHVLFLVAMHVTDMPRFLKRLGEDVIVTHLFSQTSRTVLNALRITDWIRVRVEEERRCRYGVVIEEA